VLTFDAIEKTYGATPILRGAGWSVAAGEVAVLLGPNGAGKSTLLRVLASIAAADGGTVAIEGRAKPVERRARIAFVGHSPPLTAALTVEENLRFLARAHGAAADRIAGLQVDFELTELARKPVRQLSRGQAQRTALAAAELLDRPVMLLDEPFTGLDARHRESVRARIKRWAHEEDRAVLIVMHEIEQANRDADRLAILRGGRIFEVPASVRERDDAATAIADAMQPGMREATS